MSASSALAARTPEVDEAELLRRYRDEIDRRGGEAIIVGRYNNTPLKLVDHRPADDLATLHAEGWRRYGREGNSYVMLSYLCGMEDGWPWAVRIPGTITTVGHALRWITPANVQIAKRDGKKVKRQGDIYAVETTKPHDGTGLDRLPTSHRWNPTTRYLTHHPDDGRKHRPLHVPYPARFVVQRALEMGRTGRWADGD